MALTPQEKEILARAERVLEREIEDRKHRQIVSDVTDEVRSGLKEVVNELKNIKFPEIKYPDIQIPEIKIPEIKLPEIKIPDIKIPDIKVPKIESPIITIPPIKVPKPEVTVNIPDIKIPKIEVPVSKVELTEEMRVSLKNISVENPLPIVPVNLQGKPYEFATFGGRGGGGGKVIAEKAKNTVGNNNAVDIATTATAVIAAGSNNRKSVVLVHEAADPIYIGLNTSVTTTNGFPIVANQIYGFDDYIGPIYAIISTGAAASTISLRYIEV